MGKRIWLVLGLLAVLNACATKSAADPAEEMARSYAEVVARADLAGDRLNQRMRSPGSSRDIEQFAREYSAIVTAKRQDLDKLLAKYENIAGSDHVDLVRSKILIETGRSGEAEKIVGRLSSGSAAVAAEARLQQAALHLLHRRYVPAAELLRAIAPAVQGQRQFHDLCLALAFSHPEAAVREEFTLKLIQAAPLPGKLRALLPRLHANLARLAKESGQIGKARAALDKALALETDAAEKAVLENDLRQLALLGRPAPPLAADIWLNSRPLDPAGLRGRVVVIDFWAPWCNPCRSVMPTLLRLLQKHGGKGLLVIGYTRLYGRYSDDLENRGSVPAAEELALIKRYVERSRIGYPIAVSSEGTAFDAYAVKAIPTLAIIDRRGNITVMKTGAGDMSRVEERILALLEEK